MNNQQHILIVDDKHENLIALERVLRDTNAQVTSVKSGNEALAATLRQNFALAILDVQMPEMDGLELAELLRSDDKTRHLPIILMSAVYSDDYHVFRGYAAGAVDFLTKPYEPEILLNKVRFFLLLDKQRQELEEKLDIEKSKNYLESILTSMTDSVVVVSSDLQIETVNRATRTLLGYGEDELIDTPLEGLFPNRSLPPELASGNEASPQATLHFNDVHLQTKHGDRIPVLLNVSYLHIQEPGATGIVLVAIDNTERKRDEERRLALERQLRHAQRLESIGLLAGGVAHDFNNLLTVIQTCSSLVTEKISEDDSLHADIFDIAEAARRGESLVSQLLAFSHKQDLQPEVFDLNEVVSSTARMLERTLGDDVELDIRLTPDSAAIFADPDQLTQVIMNLGVNSRDAMPQGGTLTFTTTLVTALDAATIPCLNAQQERNHNWVQLTVHDTGCGIAPDIASRVFEPFFTTKKEGQGTGLGLSVAHGIVVQSGGHISLASMPGEGTTITVYFPVTTTARRPSGSPGPVTPPKSVTGTILVVEDDNAIRRLAIRILQQRGFHALEARTLPEAIKVTSELPDLDLLLSDVVMPGHSGPEIAQTLLKVYPDLAVLFMSGYDDTTLEDYEIATERIFFLQKPFRPDTLVEKVLEVLSRV